MACFRKQAGPPVGHPSFLSYSFPSVRGRGFKLTKDQVRRSDKPDRYHSCFAGVARRSETEEGKTMGGSSDSDSDSDGPEEFTAEQAIKLDEEIHKVQRENKMRVAHEGKERRRQWAKKKTKVETSNSGVPEIKETEQQEKEHATPGLQEPQDVPGMLPSNIVNLLAAREKKTFSSDSEEEVIDRKPTTRQKKQKITGPETVLLKNIPPAPCMQNSMEFLKRRKMQVSRSHSVLKNANQALRLLSSRGSL